MRAIVAVLLVSSCRAPATGTDAPPTVVGDSTPRQAAPPPRDEAIDMSCEPLMLEWPLDGTDRVPFEKDERWGFTDASGKVVLAPLYFAVTQFTQGGVAGVIAEDGVWFIDRDGRRIAAALMFDNGPDYFVQGRARIVDGPKTGFIDAAGKIAIAPQFDAAGSFCEGLAPVCMGCKEVPRGEHTEMVGGQWGFVDRGGAVVIPIVYDSAHGFSSGVATVSKGGRELQIDRTGKEIP